MDFILFEPNVFEDARRTANAVMEGKAAIVNLHRLDQSVAQRYTDFLTGVAHAMHGRIEMPARNVILCVPREDNIKSFIQR